jgi:lipopolysaccharide heptosyltransferase II
VNDRGIAAAIRQLSSGGRILVSRLQYLGDVVLTLPVVTVLKSHFPSCEIDYLAKRPGAELLRGEADISIVHRIPDPGEGPSATLRLIGRLRERRYQVAIDFLSNPRSALLIFLSGASTRIGGTRRFRRHLYTHSVNVPAGVRSAVSHHLYSLRVLNIDTAPVKPRLTITPAESRAALELLSKMGVKESACKIGIHPGGKWQVKRWPPEKFASLARRLRQRMGVEIVVLQGPGEGEYSDRLRVLLHDEAVFLPELSVRDAAAVMSRLDAGVYCDGGAMHVSVAVGTPTVGIFGSSEPDVWFTYEEYGGYRPAFLPIECRPCHMHTCDHVKCLNGLAVETVEKAVLDVLDRDRSSYSTDDSRASDG